ncbi:MAG: hypothetical protein Q8M33_04300, partial [Hydrogenophaga sp.]|nr:hypothetical protein [Hydrogenophaga sp.]
MKPGVVQAVATMDVLNWPHSYRPFVRCGCVVCLQRERGNMNLNVIFRLLWKTVTEDILESYFHFPTP